MRFGACMRIHFGLMYLEVSISKYISVNKNSRKMATILIGIFRNYNTEIGVAGVIHC